MSGAGRKGGYRKSVTDGFLNEFPLPEEGKSLLAQVGPPRGSNVFEVVFADGSKSLALLPNRFKKLIWVKRNDYVLVTTTVDETENADADVARGSTADQATVFTGSAPSATAAASDAAATSATAAATVSTLPKIQHQIEFILGRDQIRNIKDKALWPDTFVTRLGGGNGAAGLGQGQGLGHSQGHGHGQGQRQRDDLMPDLAHSSDDDYEDADEEEGRYDKMGNTIEPGTSEWDEAVAAEEAEAVAELLNEARL
jgi:translation initiation factor IF-1